MSLVTTTYIYSSWVDAQRSSHESHSSGFWQYLFNKVFFPEPEWAVAAEQAPGSSSSLRRVDLRISRLATLGAQMKRFQIIVVEFKGPSNASGVVREVEDQTRDACSRVLDEGKTTGCYGVSTIGTTARCWFMPAEDRRLIPLFGNNILGVKQEYIEANSSEAFRIKNAIEDMKSQDNLPIPIQAVPPEAILPSQ